jgi:hypothetical protein
MDVQMDPCMQTSRIRHALSSIQLFIERCLMNLEPRVAPSSIKANQWEWMKRYRVWEANRKVFLWPENWLEPELRDDQSPIFKETMSELLQSDITEDTAATALLNYLSKLEEVAKLEPCGIHYVENDPGTEDDTAHVVARTAGAHRKYYYRRREYGYWTPWEQIKLDIEDNPVSPVVWKGRLFLFWLRILKQTPIAPISQPSTSSQQGNLGGLSLSQIKADAQADATTKAKVTVQAILCWSEYYNGKWQPARTSDVNRPTELGRFDPDGTNAFDRSKLQLSVYEEPDRLWVSISGQGASSFLLYNTHSLPVRQEDVRLGSVSVSPLLLLPSYRSLSTSTDTFSITYDRGIAILYWGGAGWGRSTLVRNVLTNTIDDRIVEPQHRLQNVWDAPFFFEDSRHVFYVTTVERLVMIPQYTGYGVIVPPSPRPVVDIPPLVLQRDPRLEDIPDGYGPILQGIDPGVVDPSPIERFVTEDVNIRTGIGTIASVRYGEQEIGPAGALADRQMP